MAQAKAAVKNTFLEFSMPGDTGEGKSQKRRTRSDMDSDQSRYTSSPLVVASKSPHASPLLGPMDEKLHAVPIDDVAFELLEDAAMGDEDVKMRFDDPLGGGPDLVAQASANLGRDEPAYIVPTTPSPFLHSAFPPQVVPPFNSYLPDMGLPPAFGSDGEGQAGADGFLEDGADGYLQQAQGLPFLPELYDSSYQYGGWGGWNEGGGGELYPPEGLAEEPLGALAGLPPPPMDRGYEERGGAAASGGNSPQQRPADRPGGGKGEKRERKDRKRDPREEAPQADTRRGAGGAAGSGAGDRRRGGQDEEASPPPRAAAGGGGGGGGGGHEGDHPYTTVMLRNIPNKYTREMLIKQLSLEFGGLFDFMYLPIDFKNRCNVGYCFINFRDQATCENFISKFHGVDVRKCLPGLNSKKIVEVTPARVQGLQENVRRLRNSPVMNQLQDHPEWMPLLFNKAGDEEPFPMPEASLPPIKARGRNREGRSNDG